MSTLINIVSWILSGIACIIFLALAFVFLDEYLRRRKAKALREAVISGDIDAGCLVAEDDENRFRKFLRRSLGAHYQHREIENPSKVELRKEVRTPKVGNPLEHDVTPAIHAKDAIISRTEVHVDWADWFRLLFGCVLQVDIVTYTENLPGMTQSESKSFAWMK